MNYLLLDVGSTFVKYMIYNGRDEIVSSSFPFPKPYLDNGVKYEVYRSDIIKTLSSVLEEALKYNCKKAFICVQMHGYLIKRKDGTMTEYVSWRDKRGNIDDERISGVDFSKNGTSLKRNLPAVSLCSFNEDFFGAEFFTLGSYISYYFAGVNITHKTDACASGFFDADTLKPVGIFTGLSLCKVSDTVELAGTYKGIEIYTPVGDHQASFLGSGAGNDKYLLNIGTATQLSAVNINNIYKQ